MSTSQFDPKETQAVYQVPFSFSHQAPSDACKEPRLQNSIEIQFLKLKRNHVYMRHIDG